MRTTGPEAICKGDMKHVKRTIKGKIAIYKPLGFEVAFNGFLNTLGAEEFKTLREMPREVDRKAYLDSLIKDFLIERAYYTFAEEYLQRQVMKNSRFVNSSGVDIGVLDVVDYIRETLEKDRLKKLKKFRGESGFKTFFHTLVSRLIIDYWRRHRTVEGHLSKYKLDFKEMFDRPEDDTAAVLIHLEDEKLKRKAAAFLPQVLDKLDFKERLVIKLKYQKSMNISEIARTLKHNRYKTEQLIRKAEIRIKEELLSKLRNKGGRHGTPER